MNDAPGEHIAMTYEIGKSFPLEVPRGLESNHLRIDELGVEIVMMLRGPNPKEIELFGSGKFSIRMIRKPNTLMFVFALSDAWWNELPFNVHRIPAEERNFPPMPPEGSGWMTRLFLVDSSTGILRHTRMLTLSRAFSCSLSAALDEQLSKPNDDAEHLREVAFLQRKAPKAMAADAIERFEQGRDAS